MKRRDAIGALGSLAVSALLGRTRPQRGSVKPRDSVDVFPTFTVRKRGRLTASVVLPQGAAASGLRLGNVPTQTDVKVRWPDGSIKHALVSAVIPSEGRYPVSSAPDMGGSYTPTWPAVTVTLAIAGADYIASLSGFSGQDTWLNGPIVRESRAIVTPATRAGLRHQFLSVIFDVRSFAAGGHKVDICVGSTNDVASNTRVFYDVSILVAGSEVYARKHTEHGSFMRWRKSFMAGMTEAIVEYDVTGLQRLKAVPEYSDISNATYTFSRGKANGGPGYDILQTGAMSPNFGDTGGRPEIGPYPEWQAIFLANRSQNALSQTLRQGDLSGSWSMHITEGDADPTHLISIDRRPNYSLLNPAPNGPQNAASGLGMSEFSQQPDCAHQPSVAYLPYLLTGDRYYADQMAFWANWCLLKQPPIDAPDARSGSRGYLRNDQVRGIAWAVRNLVDAGAWLYDTHPFKNYFFAKASANLQWLDATVSESWEGQGPHPLGFPVRLVQGNTDGLTPKVAVAATGFPDVTQFVIFAPWQYSYLCWSILHAQHQGLTGGLTMLDALLKIWRDLFVQGEWPKAHAAPFFPPVAYRRTGGTLTLFKTWKECHHASSVWRGDTQDGSSSGCPAFTDGGYGREARLALAMGRARGLRDTEGALQYLMAYSNPVTGSTMKNYIKGQFGLSLDSLK